MLYVPDCRVSKFWPATDSGQSGKMENTSAKLNISTILKIRCSPAAQWRSKWLSAVRIFTPTWEPHWKSKSTAQTFSLWTLQIASDQTSSRSKVRAAGQRPSLKSARWSSKTYCNWSGAILFSDRSLAVSWWVQLSTNLLKSALATTQTEERTLWPSIERRRGAASTKRRNMKEPMESVQTLRLAQIRWVNCVRQDPRYAI